MTLAAGTRLGPYEILSPLGAGGMGEVYRARDTRLAREVAIKVLPEALASDVERLKRFEREARSASSLNHPNIVTIYDIGSTGSTSYIAMELVKGELLSGELVGGALPVKRLLYLGVQIAEGLAKAHAAGIVHRDLKPANVMVTDEDHVKILDFGLAKLTQPEGSGAQTTLAPTVSGETAEGIIVGTVGYMSPEQATGQPVDYRSDQFSLGSILYEMATGRRAFQRASAPQTLAAIIQEEPEPIASVNPKVPAPVRWIIERCLAKEPRKRFASTDDLAGDLATVRDRLAEATSAASLAAEAPAVRRRPWWIVAAIAAGILLALGVAAWRLRHSDYFWKNPLAGARFTRFTEWEGTELDASISADGKFVAFLSDHDGQFDVWVSQVGSGEFLNLTKGQFPELLFDVVRNVGFSGDGAFVRFRVTAKDSLRSSVWLVPTMGGVARPFLPSALEAVWSPDRARMIYYAPEPGDPIFVADPNGENSKQLCIDKPGIHEHYLTWSPDGRLVYFAKGFLTTTYDMDIWRIPSASGVPERVTKHHSRVTSPTFLDERTLIYTATREDGSGSGLYGVDVEHGIPHAISSGLEEYLDVSSSADGRHLAATVANPVRNIWKAPIAEHVVDDSAAAPVPLPTVRAAKPRFGPDYLLYLGTKGGADGLWKFKDGSETELWKGREGSVVVAPAISPDGARICVAIRREGKSSLYVMSADGTDMHRLAESLDIADAPSWSPDGNWLAVVANEGKAHPLYKVPIDGKEPVRLVEGANVDPVWSPDGRFILYSESRGGASNRLRGVTPDKQPFPLPEVWLRYAGNRYRFLPDGTAIIIVQGGLRSQNFWLLDLRTGQLRQLTNLRPGFDTRSFDVSPDGKQILFDRYRENSDIVLIDRLPH